jgi:hypothetical protein
MNVIFSSGRLRIKPPPFFLLSSAKEKTVAASKSNVKGSLRFSEGTEKGKTNRLTSEAKFSDIRIPHNIIGGYAFLKFARAFLRHDAAVPFEL